MIKLFSDRGKDTLPRNRIVALLLCWSLLVPTLCYALFTNAVLIPAIALACIAIALALPRSARLTARSYIYCAIIPLAFVGLLTQVYKINMDDFYLDIQALFPFVIFTGIALSFLDQRPIPVSISLVCGLFGMLLQGLLLNRPQPTWFDPGHPVLNDQFVIFSLGIIAQSYSVLHLPKYARHTQRITDREDLNLQFRRIFFTAGSTILLFGLTIGLSYGARATYDQMDRYFSSNYRNYLNRVRKRTVFTSVVSTNITMDAKTGAESNQPALYVRSEIPPGYLRGRAYQTYDKGRWISPDQKETLPLQRGEGSLSVSSYAPPAKKPLKTVDVFLARNFAPDVLYLSGNMHGIELIAERLSTNPDRIIRPEQWQRNGGYRYTVLKIDQGTAATIPETPGQEYLQLPYPVDATAFALAEEIIPKNAPAHDAVRLVEHYLQNNYEYDLSPADGDPDVDPVINFLESRRKGHCELFASAAALILRARGIHTRYVTGFVCFEGTAGNWTSKFRDCHAWLEAWVPEEGWILVEPTPASGVPGATADSGVTIGALWNSFKGWLLAMVGMVQRGYFAQAIMAFLTGIWSAAVWMLWSGPWYIGWPILLATGLIVWKIRRKQPEVMGLVLAEEYNDLKDALTICMTRLEIECLPTMSVRDLIAGVRSSQVPGKNELEKLLLDYESLRYAPSLDTVRTKELLTRLRAVVN